MQAVDKMFVTFSLEILGTVVQCSEGEKFQKVKCLHYMPFTSGDFVGNKSSKLLASKLLCEGDLILGGFVKHREDSCWKVLGCVFTNTVVNLCKFMYFQSIHNNIYVKMVQSL